MEFTIDRSKWRCGGGGPYANGEGETQLLNHKGYMCCLGQISLQLGYKETEIVGSLTPVNASLLFELDKDGILVCNSLTGGKANSDLTNAAMGINDNPHFTDKEREKELIELFKKGGHSIKFVNETRKH